MNKIEQLRAYKMKAWDEFEALRDTMPVMGRTPDQDHKLFLAHERAVWATYSYDNATKWEDA